MKTRNFLALLIIISLQNTLWAQRKPVPYVYVREADVMWSKTVWRVIDLREKINQPLYYPLVPLSDRKSLFDILSQGVLGDGENPAELTAYSAREDEFSVKLNKSEVKSIFLRPDTVEIPDSLRPDLMVKRGIKVPLTAGDVVQYWLKETWFFDKQRSVMETRILGIMPVIQKKNEKGDVVGLSGTCWFYFPETRPLLAKNNAFNRKNSAQRLSYDDVFLKRQFSSYIIKEDNVFDRMIADYKGPNTLDALLEAENIRDKINTLEMDMWQH